MATLVLNPETSDARFVQLNHPSILIGCAPDADVLLVGLQKHHARIEHKPDGYYIISLDSPDGVLVNGDEVTFLQLKHGDKIEFGDIKAVLLLADEEVPVQEGAVHEDPMPIARANARPPAMQQNRCPQCGMPVVQGFPSCPQCGAALSGLPAMPTGFIPPTPLNQAGPGILPIIAFLAALTIVGAPVALVLGLMTLSIIRKRGGTVRDRSLAKWSVGLGLVWLMLGAVAAGAL